LAVHKLENVEKFIQMGMGEEFLTGS